jgi:hypothetical protein
MSRSSSTATDHNNPRLRRRPSSSGRFACCKSPLATRTFVAFVRVRKTPRVDPDVRIVGQILSKRSCGGFAWSQMRTRNEIRHSSRLAAQGHACDDRRRAGSRRPPVECSIHPARLSQAQIGRCRSGRATDRKRNRSKMVDVSSCCHWSDTIPAQDGVDLCIVGAPDAALAGCRLLPNRLAAAEIWGHVKCGSAPNEDHAPAQAWRSWEWSRSRSG